MLRIVLGGEDRLAVKSCQAKMSRSYFCHGWLFLTIRVYFASIYI